MITTDFQSTRRLTARVHFNRVEMQRGGEHVWTVHTCEGCFQVKDVQLRTSFDTKFKPMGVQPRAFFKGRTVLEVKNGIAICR